MDGRFVPDNPRGDGVDLLGVGDAGVSAEGTARAGAVWRRCGSSSLWDVGNRRGRDLFGGGRYTDGIPAGLVQRAYRFSIGRRKPTAKTGRRAGTV